MEIKDFLEKLTADDLDLLLLQDSTDGLYKHIKKANLLVGLSSGGGTGLSPWQVKSTNYQAKSNERLAIDLSNNNVNILLPVTPSIGSEIEIISFNKTDNSNKVIIKTDRYEVNLVAYRKIHFIYFGSEIGWLYNLPTNIVATSVELPGIYAVSNSSIYSSSLAPSYQNLNDNLGTTGTATNSSSFDFVKIDFGKRVLASSVTLGGGNLSGWGGVSSYLNNAIFAYSLDDVNWTTVFTVSGITDSGVSQFREFIFDRPLVARYFRLSRANYLAVTEIRFK